jgi:large subunit ribosomal protein L10
MPKPHKVEAVAELADRFQQSAATVLTDYRGLSVAQITSLRTALGTQTTYAVVKNTLTKLAARDAGLTELDSFLQGPTAIAFVKGDPVEAAKGLRNFARTNPMLVIKGGVLDGKTLTAAEVARIADLESREVLLAKLAGGMKANLTKAAALFQAPIAQMARLAEALKDKLPADASTEAPADAPAADATAADAPAADTTAADAPAADTTAADAPAADTTAADATAADAPAADATAADVTAADAPAADAPAADADAPAADATATDATPADADSATP